MVFKGCTIRLSCIGCIGSLFWLGLMSIVLINGIIQIFIASHSGSDQVLSSALLSFALVAGLLIMAVGSKKFMRAKVQQDHELALDNEVHSFDSNPTHDLDYVLSSKQHIAHERITSIYANTTSED